MPDRQGFAIVVDEGPGLSGSSMASVAEALAAGGIAPERIVFFPGHGNGPGDRRGAREARWWTAERCWLSPAPCPPDQRPGWDWVFGGFAAAAPDLSTLAGIKQARQRRLAAEGLALPSPAAVEGWIALHGAGCPLTRDDLSADVLRGTLAPYVSRAALPVPDETVSAGAIDRIAAALAACGLEGCGAENRARAQCRALPLAGDGRMAPGEWLRLADGRVMKRNAMGSDCEHDWAGAQSLLWDVAGAMVEWDMDADAIPVMRGVDAEAVAFHEAGYCCLGLAKAQHAGDEAAARRCGVALRSAAARMRVST